MHRVQSQKMLPTWNRKMGFKRKHSESTEDANNNLRPSKLPVGKSRLANKRSVEPRRFQSELPNLQLWRKEPEGWSQSTETIVSILAQMRKDELLYQPSQCSASSHIEPWMRATLIDWMIQVDHHFRLSFGTLFRAVQMVDRYTHLAFIDVTDYQLIGVTAIWTATKLEERYVTELDELIELTDGTSTMDQAYVMERSLLQRLDFHLNTPEPSFYIRFYADLCRESMSVRDHQISVRRSWFLLDLLLTQPLYVDTLASKAAAAAFCLVLHQQQIAWPSSIEVLIGYTVKDLSQLMHFMAYLLQCAPNDKKYTGAYEKFSSSRFGGVAKDKSWIDSFSMMEQAQANSLPVGFK